MILDKNLQTNLESQGVTVTWYPEDTYEEFKIRVWKEEYRFSYDYNKVFDKKHKELDKQATRFANDYMTYRLGQRTYDATIIYIRYKENGNDRIFTRKCTKGFVVTEDYVLKALARDRKAYMGKYGNFADTVNKILKAECLDRGIFVYPTTYGIGVWHLWNFGFASDCKIVADVLDKHNLTYKTEFSEKNWIYRFKITNKNKAALAILG